MTSATLVLRGLLHYWRTHLGVLLGSAVACATLVGALLVGDSVRGTLRSLALAGVGKIDVAMQTGDRLFPPDLADRVGKDLGCPSAAVLQLTGMVVDADGAALAGNVQVLGVDERFWALGGGPVLLPDGQEELTVLNERLARQLNARPGDTIILRVSKPALLSHDAPLSGEAAPSATLHLRVLGIASDEQFGRFSLQRNQAPPASAFVPRKVLSWRAAKADRANVLLLGGSARGQTQVSEAAAAMRRVWKLPDASLVLRELPDAGAVELRSPRVFLDPAVGQAAAQVPGATGLLTYFAKQIGARGRNTPYSIVAAVGPLGEAHAAGATSGPGARSLGLVPLDLRDNQVVINTWLSRDLGDANTGDKLNMTYLVLGPMRKLSEANCLFTVRGVGGEPNQLGDRQMLPDFPGLAGVDTMRGWRPGIHVEPNLIRPKDDAYWRDYRGTPKAFVCLAAGQRLWGNRYGDLTAVRWALAPGALERIEESLREHLDPAGVGSYFQPVRQRALAAADQAMDFGQLFLGLSLFLIASALILTSLLFVFGVQQRTAELGTLLAVGLSPSHVRGLMLGEGLVLAVLGAVLGAGGGVLYTRALLWGLSTIWKGAVAGAGIQFHADPLRILAGSGIGAGASMCAMWLALRRLTHRPARELLAGESVPTPGATRRRKSWALTIFLVAAGGGIAVAAWRPGGDESGVATFFTAGTLILVAAMALWFWRLNWDVDHPPRRLTLSGLGSRNAVRRPWRSLAVVALLGSGSFLLITVAANVRGSPEDPVGKIGGTGGFDLYAESTLPVVRDLNDPNVRKSLPIDPNLLATLAGADVVPLRVRPGDDASCLNLNRAQTPRLLGVHPGDFTGRFSFVKTAGAAAGDDPWGMLKGPAGGDEVPGIGDEPTVVWGLDKRLGDTVDYVDERGRPFRVRIVGIIAGSILQGNLLISRERFEARFPSETGYRAFLVDCLTERPEAVSNALRQALGAEGLTVMPARERLADFNAVQNAYLTVFAVLGGLGMLLGTVGLGLVVMRNVLERRAELAILRATGFPKGTIRRVLLAEHWRLLGNGALCGCVASVCVVLPGLVAGQIAVPVLWMSGAIAGIFLSGAFWTWLATRWATRGPLLDALRNE